MLNSSTQVAIIDYGMGNLRSVAHAFEAIGSSVAIVHQPEELQMATHLVLPGVGAFRDGMKNLQNAGWIPMLERMVLEQKKPFLGICLGMQLLATWGTEQGEWKGLGWVDAIVERLPAENPKIRVPHVGWNEVKFLQTHHLFQGLAAQQDFYFVHSYALLIAPDVSIAGVTTHGHAFVSSIAQENIYATQFHPEKSQKAGLAVLRNFLNCLQPGGTSC
ncbi:MAG: imidazole glycerol phosphate synthase subunit HisH [Synechococcales bacterium]|nr:imidazole glycerol phosphate synthase subunit HisH [Synechococcales bacterium]